MPRNWVQDIDYDLAATATAEPFPSRSLFILPLSRHSPVSPFPTPSHLPYQGWPTVVHWCTKGCSSFTGTPAVATSHIAVVSFTTALRQSTLVECVFHQCTIPIGLGCVFLFYLNTGVSDSCYFGTDGQWTDTLHFCLLSEVVATRGAGLA